MVCSDRRVSSKRGCLEPCDDERAASCAFFDPKWDEARVEADFDRVMKNPSECGQKYPKVALLMWVLEGRVGASLRPVGSKRAAWRDLMTSGRAFLAAMMGRSSGEGDDG